MLTARQRKSLATIVQEHNTSTVLLAIVDELDARAERDKRSAPEHAFHLMRRARALHVLALSKEFS